MDAWKIILSHISFEDLPKFLTLNKSFFEVFQDDEFWKQRVCLEFGYPWLYRDILKQNSIFASFPSKFDVEPISFHKYYLQRHKENTENVNVQNMLNTARTGILNFQRNPSDMEVLSKATDILIECLEIEPTSFESVYLLAYSCYVLNDFSTCMKFFDLLDETETNFPAADELKHEVLQLLEGVQGTIEYPPLILENELSQEAGHILTEIFKVLDTENKGYLGIDEFNRHILFTGGSHKVDAEQFNQITRNYNENAQLGLSLQGFMNLYYEQILHDPSEFRKDLELYNMDPYLLKPKSIKAAQCA